MFLKSTVLKVHRLTFPNLSTFQNNTNILKLIIYVKLQIFNERSKCDSNIYITAFNNLIYLLIIPLGLSHNSYSYYTVIPRSIRQWEAFIGWFAASSKFLGRLMSFSDVCCEIQVIHTLITAGYAFIQFSHWSTILISRKMELYR